MKLSRKIFIICLSSLSLLQSIHAVKYIQQHLKLMYFTKTGGYFNNQITLFPSRKTKKSQKFLVLKTGSKTITYDLKDTFPANYITLPDKEGNFFSVNKEKKLIGMMSKGKTTVFSLPENEKNTALQIERIGKCGIIINKFNKTGYLTGIHLLDPKKNNEIIYLNTAEYDCELNKVVGSENGKNFIVKTAMTFSDKDNVWKYKINELIVVSNGSKFKLIGQSLNPIYISNDGHTVVLENIKPLRDRNYYIETPSDKYKYFVYSYNEHYEVPTTYCKFKCTQSIPYEKDNVVKSPFDLYELGKINPETIIDHKVYESHKEFSGQYYVHLFNFINPFDNKNEYLRCEVESKTKCKYEFAFPTKYSDLTVGQVLGIKTEKFGFLLSERNNFTQTLCVVSLVNNNGKIKTELMGPEKHFEKYIKPNIDSQKLIGFKLYRVHIDKSTGNIAYIFHNKNNKKTCIQYVNYS